MPDTPVRILPELRRLTADELAAEVRGIRSGKARGLPVRLSLPGALTLAHLWGIAQEGQGFIMWELSRGKGVPRDALLADVDAVIEHCQRTRPPGIPEEDDVDLAQLRLLREWAETQR